MAWLKRPDLLEVYEGIAENVDRFEVPDLYGCASGATRKGQT